MTWDFIGLLALLAILYPVMAVDLAGIRSSDAAGKGTVIALAAMSGLGVWIVLFMLFGMASDSRSWGFGILGFFALLVSSVVTLVDATLGRRRYLSIILPLPFLVLVVWARLA